LTAGCGGCDCLDGWLAEEVFCFVMVEYERSNAFPDSRVCTSLHKKCIEICGIVF
jgi:hypothetical protein